MKTFLIELFDFCADKSSNIEHNLQEGKLGKKETFSTDCLSLTANSTGFGDGPRCSFEIARSENISPKSIRNETTNSRTKIFHYCIH